MPGEFLDRYSRGSTVCHRLSVGLKLLVVVTAITVAVCVPVRYWPLHGVLAGLIFVGHTLADVPLAYLVRRIAIFLPSVGIAALAVPASHGFATGYDVGLSIVVRSTVAFSAGLWLVCTTPFDRLLATLSRLGMPNVLGATLAFAYRYSFVLFDELARMRTAQRARTFGRPGLLRRWHLAVQLVGMLAIRSISRSERIYQAMCSRGWQGQMRTLD
jgi:cobalt/nickel transport system permease protein